MEASQHLLQRLHGTSPLLADQLAEAMRAEQRHASFQVRQEFDTNTLRGRIADLEAQIEDQQADELVQAEVQEERLADLRQMLLAEGERLGYLELDLSQHQDLVAHLNAIPEGEADWRWIADELDAEGLLLAILAARQQMKDQAESNLRELTTMRRLERSEQGGCYA